MGPKEAAAPVPPAPPSATAAAHSAGHPVPLLPAPPPVIGSISRPVHSPAF
eukprot:NODE_3698_length_414_cov_3.208219_g3264_i0.p2 GENE.NODE_3698_length_414_cov_3.208219_g3264_i0~~NODE_3698_length_414_cov_3.208219_g3264_i0.p2  ORF type:complete len:51 (-),score=1.87 NODE_3698_length_414_cov_3.208219_g3264_i0:81-233(-)